MKRLSIRYLAGLMDGEGCIDFQKGTDTSFGLYIRPRIRITMVVGAKELLENVQNNFGGYLEHRKGKGTFSDSYTWIIAGKDHTLKFLKLIQKYLLIKRQQALFAIWWLENMSGRQKKSDGYQKISKIRQFAYDEMKRLKKDPQRLSERAVRTINELMR